MLAIYLTKVNAYCDRNRKIWLLARKKFPIAFLGDLCYTGGQKEVIPMKKIMALLFAVLMLLSGCSGDAPCTRETIFCMDTVIELKIWGKDREEALTQIKDMLKEMEQTWSCTQEDSFLSKLNRGEATADESQQALLDLANSLSERTGGAFDPKLRSLVDLWGFYDDDPHLPSEEEISQAKQIKQWDLGAIVKGYAGKRALEILQNLDVDRAILNLGGNVQTYGMKPKAEKWNVAIQNPKDGRAMGMVSFYGANAVVTSGDYQRYFDIGGEIYHHILDPETGMPAQNGLSSVTIICEDGAVADALSTALFVMGLEEATEFWRQSQDFEAVFVTWEGAVYATQGAGFSGCAHEVIRREN